MVSFLDLTDALLFLQGLLFSFFFHTHFRFFFRKYTLRVCYVFNVICRILLILLLVGFIYSDFFDGPGMYCSLHTLDIWFLEVTCFNCMNLPLLSCMGSTSSIRFSSSVE